LTVTDARPAAAKVTVPVWVPGAWPAARQSTTDSRMVAGVVPDEVPSEIHGASPLIEAVHLTGDGASVVSVRV
jgi:hypothetical protein